MIYLVTGNPGSGKSYFAVEKISRIKDQSKVLHNVDGLKLGVTLDDVCSKNDFSPITLFTNSYHKNNDTYRGWHFVLDECQTLFPKNLRNDDVFRFFQLHRHYGIDIILLSQDYKLISPSVTLLAEFQFRAVSDTANPLPGTFMYRKMVGWEQIGKKFLRKKQKVFDLYKTADFDQKKVKKKARPMFILFAVCILASLFGLYKFVDFKGSFSKDKDSTKNESTFPTKEKKDMISNFNKDENNRYGEKEMYPQSYLEKLKDLTLLPLDTIEDSTGRYFMFMGTLWPAADLPYKIIKTKLGYCALVPLDIYEYINNQKALLSELTPDNPDNEITSSSESNFTERKPSEQFN